MSSLAALRTLFTELLEYVMWCESDYFGPLDVRSVFPTSRISGLLVMHGLQCMRTKDIRWWSWLAGWLQTIYRSSFTETGKRIWLTVSWLSCLSLPCILLLDCLTSCTGLFTHDCVFVCQFVVPLTLWKTFNCLWTQAHLTYVTDCVTVIISCLVIRQLWQSSLILTWE